MANWKYKINIKQYLKDDNADPAQVGKKIANELRRRLPKGFFNWENEIAYDEEIDNIVEALENITGYDDTSPRQELNDWLDSLYDWGDLEVAPFDQWPPNKMCWMGL